MTSFLKKRFDDITPGTILKGLSGYNGDIPDIGTVLEVNRADLRVLVFWGSTGEYHWYSYAWLTYWEFL